MVASKFQVQRPHTPFPPLQPPCRLPDFEVRSAKFQVASSKLPPSDPPSFRSRSPRQLRSLKALLLPFLPPEFEVRSLKISSKIAFSPVLFLCPWSCDWELQVQTFPQCFLCPCGEESVSTCTSSFLSAGFGIKGIMSLVFSLPLMVVNACLHMCSLRAHECNQMQGVPESGLCRYEHKWMPDS